MNLDDLIAALEKGPSRELDAEIFRVERADAGIFDMIFERAKIFAPYYTSSLDAALTLVPEGFTVEIQMWPGHPSTVTILGTRWEPFGEKREMAHVHHSVDGRWEASAATPATAVCIAALKARKK